MQGFALICDSRITNPETLYASLLIQNMTRYGQAKKFYINNELLNMYMNEDISSICEDNLSILNKMGFLRRMPKSDWYYSCSNMYSFLSSRYTIIYQSEFNTIIKSNKKNKLRLLYHFVQLMASVNYETKIGFLPISAFAESEGVSEKAIASYNRDLQEMGLIYILGRKPNMETGEYRTNYYGRAEMKDDIDRRVGVYGHSDEANEHRSITQRYNQMAAHPESYTDLQRTAFKHELSIYNERYPDRAKDLTFLS